MKFVISQKAWYVTMCLSGMMTMIDFDVADLDEGVYGLCVWGKNLGRGGVELFW
jgi:hypothetical protein